MALATRIGEMVRDYRAAGDTLEALSVLDPDPGAQAVAASIADTYRSFADDLDAALEEEENG